MHKPLITLDEAKRQGLKNLREWRFCLAYVSDGKQKAATSARIAGYTGNPATLSVQGARLLKKDRINLAIQRLQSGLEKTVAKGLVNRGRVLLETGEIAIADMADVFEDDGSFDIKLAQARGVSKLIKAIKYDNKGEGKIVHIEMYSRVEALRMLGQHHKLWVDRILQIDGTPAEKKQRLLQLFSRDEPGDEKSA